MDASLGRAEVNGDDASTPGRNPECSIVGTNGVICFGLARRLDLLVTEPVHRPKHLVHPR